MLVGVIRPLLHSKELDSALNIIAQVLVLKLDLERTGYPVLFKQSSDESRIYLREAPTLKEGVRQPIILAIFFAKNCMKSKQWTKRGHVSLAPPPGSANTKFCGL